MPALGSGRIFPVARGGDRRRRRSPSRAHWPQIGGIDFGWDHPTAAVELAWDRDADMRLRDREPTGVREATPLIHAGALQALGRDAALGLAA